MTTRPVAPTSSSDADELLSLALSRPAEALSRAQVILAGQPTPQVASVAHQAIGVVHRDFGDIEEATRDLRTALRWARRAMDPDRTADIQASLGVALVMAGRTRRGLDDLDAVVREVAQRDDGSIRTGRVLIRRAWALWSVGRNDEALADADRAVDLLRGRDDPVWEARAYDHRATVLFALGAIDRADLDYARSEALFAQSGQVLEYADAKQERGAAAFARGNIPGALTLLDEAQQILEDLGVFEPGLSLTRCDVLLTAGLAMEAFTESEAAVERSRVLGGSSTRRAELMLSAARAAHAAGDWDAAKRRSAQALALFRRQRRTSWACQAELVLISARHASGWPGSSLLRQARALARQLDQTHPPRAGEGHLLAGRLALDCGRRRVAEDHLQSAILGAGRGLHGPLVEWVARARLYEMQGRGAPTLNACRRGLGLVEGYVRTLGATELRASATAHGAELVMIAQRHALHRGDARQLLMWSERWRATALRVPAFNPQAGDALQSELAALRRLARRLDDAVPGAHVSPLLQQERRRLEESVRRRVRRTSSPPTGPGDPNDSNSAVRELGATDLLELIDVGGELYVVTASRRRVRLTRVGSTATADRALSHALFALRREAISAGTLRLDLAEISRRLERAVLGDSLAQLGDGPVLVVPTARLHSVPWAMMPSLRDRDVAVAPSASAWLRAKHAPAVGGRVVLVGGPRLSTGMMEVRELARHYPDAVVLADGAATANGVLAAMDGAWLVHVAAHGTFRADNPSFSALELDDGPLTVYDMERLKQAPHRIVLSSCNSAVGSPSGMDELLGLVSVLISSGSAGVLASVVPVNDPASVPFMVDLHRWLSGGATLSQAHLNARVVTRANPATRAVADSFVALGV